MNRSYQAMKLTGQATKLTGAETALDASRAHKRLRLLATLLVLLLCAYAVRLYGTRRPPTPPASASLEVKLRYYRDRISRDPSDVDAYVALGRLEEASGYFMSAVRRLTEARALGAPDREIAGTLGRSLLHLARFGEAKTELEKAVRLAPDNVEATANLAGWYNGNDQSNGAIRLLRAFVEAHPAYLTPTAAVSRQDLERLLLCCAEIGDREETLKLADRLIQVVPEDPTGYAISGKVLLEEHRPREAHEQLAKALKLGPDQATLYFYNGVSLSLLGDHARALNEWLRAITLD